MTRHAGRCSTASGKRGELTPEEAAEKQELQEKIAMLPTGRDFRDQEAMDLIHEAAKLVKKFHIATESG